ncbi:MAG: hypothetical protein IJ016_02010 [Elusimicrobiaceae bacterium]|nr:hypothetical protein [Elusimicrobiaceae bacterium]MBR5608725.1 hypothetical protein [Elusimicrobiaceae bacterium]
MKHLFLISLFFVSAAAVSAHPRTTVVVTHPQTDTTSVVRPRTNVVVNRPVTAVTVEKPLTAGGATENFVRGNGEEKPAATPKAATAAPSAKTAAANSYEPSYKKSKNLTPKKADQSSGAADGLGLKDPVAAQKEAEARSSAVQKALDEGSFNKIVPPEIMGKLKQRNHEAAKAAGKK